MSQIESATAQAKYAAFISYRHADKAWGDWLHKSLEAYRVPKALIGTAGDYGPVPARLGRVFRDREELGAAHDLGQEIQAALRDSASLVVICSPGAARRRWVNEEILYWKRLGRADRVFPIIVDGEAVGAVVVGTTSNVTTVGELEEGLVVTAAGYFARQVG